MLTYIIYGQISFVVIWLLYVAFMHTKETIDKWPKVIKYPAMFIFGLGYLADILWSLIYGSVGNYLLDRASGYSHKQAIFWVKFAKGKLTWKTTYLLTFTYRMKVNLVLREKGDYSFDTATTICHDLLERHDPDHCSVDKMLKLIGMK